MITHHNFTLLLSHLLFQISYFLLHCFTVIVDVEKSFIHKSSKLFFRNSCMFGQIRFGFRQLTPLLAHGRYSALQVIQYCHSHE